jgi:HK97 gp10 family phage protein
MITRSATIEGMDALFKAMDELSQEITKGKTARIWKNSMRYAFEPVKDTAKMIIEGRSRDTGQLANSLYMSVHKPTARDKRSGSYMGETYMARVSIRAAREESQHRTTTYTTKKGKTITKKYVAFHGSNRPVAMALEFGTAKMSAEPFFRSALEANIQRVQQRLASALWRELTYGKYAKDAGIDFTGKI